MKECNKCFDKKPLTEFYKAKGMKDGRLNKCKECTISDVKTYRENNIEKVREYDRKRGMLPHRVQARADYQQTKAGKKAMSKANRKYRQNNPNKYHAHNMVNNAIRDGKLFKEPCEVCGCTERIHGHHDDYLKPLNVRWLCAVHHSQWHKENGEGLNP